MLLLLALACAPDPVKDVETDPVDTGTGADGGSTTPEPNLAWFRDADGDGQGDPEVPTWAPEAPDGYVELGTDCDDSDPEVYLGAVETCDDVDQDCDGEVDEDLPRFAAWPDADEDGFGDPALEESVCRLPEGYVENAEDCDDADPDAWPMAEEDWTDDRDSDCDGEVETAGPVRLSGGEVQEVQLTLPDGTATRVISVRGPAAVRLTVDLAQPSRLVLIGKEVDWTVEDLRGTVADTVRVVADAVAVTLDDPLFYDQRSTMESAYGPLASWHGAPASGAEGEGPELLLSELSTWPESEGWPACDRPTDEAPFGPGMPLALPCSGLNSPVCLTVQDQSVVALDFTGGRCEVLDLAAPMSGSTLLWSNDTLLLTEGGFGSLSRYDLGDGERQRAWLWPQSVLHYRAEALLVPGQAYADLDPSILYSYASWGDLQCGDGSNVTGIWSDELDVCTISEGLAWWPEDPVLRSYDIASGIAAGLSPPDLGEVLGLSSLLDGSLVLLFEDELRAIDPLTGSVRASVVVEGGGQGLACAGE